MPKKRANGEGSIYQRKDGRWGYAYTVNGKQISRAAKTQAEAVSRLQEARAKILAGTYTDPSKITMEGWLTLWLKEYAAPAVRKSTLASYKSVVDNHLIPALGKTRLQALRPDQVQSFINKQVKEGCAPSSVKRHVVVLKRALEQAKENHLISQSPADAAKLPKMEQKEIEFLTAAEVSKLLNVLPMTTNGRALRFILGTGLRVSELCGLRWCDIEADGFNVNQITYIINGKALSEDEKESIRVCTAPKTKAGKRFIPFNQKMLELLEEQRIAQKLDRMRAGEAWEGKDPSRGKQYVFATSTGKPADRHNLGRTLRNCLDQAELKRRGVHALRHTFATLWVQRGQDIRTLSEILGHTNVAFTMQKYVHSDTETKKRGMAAMSDII